MMQQYLQSFKITNIRQLDENWQETEAENPVTRQQLAKVLSETILGVDIEQFEDHWAGDLQIDINIFDNSIYGDSQKRDGYGGSVYEVLTDAEGVTSQGRQIADFDIELFTDRNGDHVLLECGGCGLILTNGELEACGEDINTDMTDYRLDCEPGSIIPFAEHFQSDGVNWCGCFHEFDYSKVPSKVTA
jgi:hypothetical protein